MQLRKLIDSSCGLRFMIDNLCTHSSYSRKLLLESKMLYDKTTIQKSYSVLKEFYKVVENDENKNKIQTLRFCPNFCPLLSLTINISHSQTWM